MAITPLTGFKSFTFGDVVSTDYGVQILGEGVFNAPERVVEMIEIPGRNGTFALDKGRFENIEVTYPATLIADNVTDFAEALSDLRNALCSKRGYMRLEDDYHPDEYRMAVYKEGLEVDEEVLRVGKFNIKFDCKPQRFLTSGETAVSVDSGDTLTNPTLFEASPMLEVEGYGDIVLNGYSISINDEPIGEIELVPATRASSSYNGDYYDESALVEDGDTMTMGGFTVEIDVTLRPVSTYVKIASVVSSRPSHTIPNYIGIETTKVSDQEIRKIFKYGEQSFTKQNAAVTYTDSLQLAITLEKADETQDTFNYTFDLYVRNHGATGTSARHLIISRTNISGQKVYFGINCDINASAFIAESTQSVLGHPTCIDCDLGEAYKEVNGQIVSLNRYIALGSELPNLSVGESEITFDNTITDLQVTPRWWKI